ncbi:MAG: DNA polymerase III subunit alpha, partial [Alphaproteobacteria bacterium]
KTPPRLGVTLHADLLGAARRRAVRATLAGTVVRKHERRNKNGEPFAFVGVSDPTGMFEVMVFSEALSASRALLEAGKSVLLKVSGDWQDDELKLRAISIESLDAAASHAGEGLRIYLKDTSPLAALAAELRHPGKGLVTFVVPGDAGQEVEIALAGRIQVTPQLKEAIQSMQGVTEVQTV